jgi:predicted AAA+ superfamily ATPase
MMETIGSKKTLFIDEAQKIPGIGENLKLLIDSHPELSVIVTGSSSFELAGQTGEPLTGRKKTILLYPLSLLELSAALSPADLKHTVEKWLITGSYPQIVTAENTDVRNDILSEITDSYLYKDILEFEKIRNPKKLRDLLQHLAFQIGSQVSLNELAGKLSIDVKTVGRYLDLLEKSYIIYSLRGFSTNLRNEITSKAKYYFYDLGVRNMIINNLNPLTLRDDQGKLWENFVVIERLKLRDYTNFRASDYFWRTWEQSEVDLIEDYAGQLHAYEFKWSEKKPVTAPMQFVTAYPNSSFSVITPSNALDFLTKQPS